MDDEYGFVKTYIASCEWLDKQCNRVTEQYFELEKQFRQYENNGEDVPTELIEKLESVYKEMVDIENRLIFEEKQYSDIMKKLDDMTY